jgi:hypothetical protein
MNGDGLDDVVIGAPLHTDLAKSSTQYETGRIYVVYQNEQVNMIFILSSFPPSRALSSVSLFHTVLVISNFQCWEVNRSHSNNRSHFLGEGVNKVSHELFWFSKHCLFLDVKVLFDSNIRHFLTYFHISKL